MLNFLTDTDGLSYRSVKRHGYPIGGMRSESPLKKQPATEEMHMESDGETASAKADDGKPAPEEKAAKKATTKRASKKKTDG